MLLPDNIAEEIADKRASDSSDQKKDEDNKDDDQGTDTDQQPADDKPEPPKKDKAAKPTNGQSIAQVAAATDVDDDAEDDDDDGDDEKSKSKSGKSRSILQQLISVRKDLKIAKKDKAEIISLINDLAKNGKGVQQDEISEYAEQWGLNPEGTKGLVELIKKQLSAKAKPDVQDDEDDDDDNDEDEPVAKKAPKKAANVTPVSVRKIELAVESEYEDYLDSFPQAKGKINLKAIKLFIMSDPANLQKPFTDVVADMYPGLLVTKKTVEGDSNNNSAPNDDGDGIDFNDKDVQARIRKDPKLKEKYEEDLERRAKSIFQ